MAIETEYSFAIKLKPIEWFEENAFLDHDGDYHPTKDDRYYYDNYHSMPKDGNGKLYYKSIYSKNILDRIMYIIKYESEKLELYKWGIEEIYTPETHPQYFIWGKTMEWKFKSSLFGKQILQIKRKKPVGEYGDWEYYWDNATQDEANKFKIEIELLKNKMDMLNKMQEKYPQYFI